MKDVKFLLKKMKKHEKTPSGTPVKISCLFVVPLCREI